MNTKDCDSWVKKPKKVSVDDRKGSVCVAFMQVTEPLLIRCPMEGAWGSAVPPGVASCFPVVCTNSSSVGVCRDLSFLDRI